MTLPIGGTVSITVGGDTFTEMVSPTLSASTMAAALASEMNKSLSPVIATVNGAKISIVSAVNGALTNYPIITSYTTIETGCTPANGCYTTPAFQAVASGSNLTGGTD